MVDALILTVLKYTYLMNLTNNLRSQCKYIITYMKKIKLRVANIILRVKNIVICNEILFVDTHRIYLDSKVFVKIVAIALKCIKFWNQY